MSNILEIIFGLSANHVVEILVIARCAFAFDGFCDLAFRRDLIRDGGVVWAVRQARQAWRAAEFEFGGIFRIAMREATGFFSEFEQRNAGADRFRRQLVYRLAGAWCTVDGRCAVARTIANGGDGRVCRFLAGREVEAVRLADNGVARQATAKNFGDFSGGFLAPELLQKVDALFGPGR